MALAGGCLEEGGEEGEGLVYFFLPAEEGLDALAGVFVFFGEVFGEALQALFAGLQFGAELGVEEVSDESAQGPLGGVVAVALSDGNFAVDGADGLEEFESLAGGAGADLQALTEFLLQHGGFGAVEGAVQEGGGAGESEGFEEGDENGEDFLLPEGDFKGCIHGWWGRMRACGEFGHATPGDVPQYFGLERGWVWVGAPFCLWL